MKIRNINKFINFSNHRKISSLKAGQPPGSLIYTGKEKDRPVKLELVQYDQDNFEMDVFDSFGTVVKRFKKTSVNWLLINNLTNIDLIEQIGSHFDIHTLTLEDILNVEGLPKVEETGEHLFLTLKLVKFEDGILSENHVSIVLGENFLLTFSDSDEDIFYSLKQRVKTTKSRARIKKEDYLFYLITDFLVDNYFVVFDELYSKIENIEAKLIESVSENHIHSIHKVKKELGAIRKTLNPLEKAIGMILKDEYDIIKDENEIFFRDIYDHLGQLTHISDSNREFISSLLELNSSNLNTSMNQTIKILTIITSIFIPITFIAGIYGMNFVNMPELETRYGYFIVLFIMILVASGMIYFMNKKGFFK